MTDELDPSGENPEAVDEPIEETPAVEIPNEEPPVKKEEPVAGHVERLPIMSEVTESDRKAIDNDPESVLSLMMSPVSEMKDATSDDVADVDKKHLRKYMISLVNAISNHIGEEQEGNSPFDQEDAIWRQAATHETGHLAAARPRMAHSRNGVVSSKRAADTMRAAMGLGTSLIVPLWHTGIWVRINAPMNITLLEMQRRIGMSKISLGRSTSGAAFNNMSVYTYSHLIDMILDHVDGGTLGNVGPQVLKETIKVTDMPILIQSMAAIVWPNGYPLTRPCVSDPAKCTHIDEAHINIGRLHWVNDRMLSTYQRNLMSKRESIVSAESLVQYQLEHTAPQEKTVEINDRVKITLKVPTIAEYLESGHRWVDNIIVGAHDAFGTEISDSERDDYVSQCAAASRLRVYSHWVDTIVFFEDGEESERIVERQGIENALETLTPETEVCDDIIKRIDAYIPQSIISAIGIPRYTCPSCKGKSPDEGNLKNLPEILQLEVAQVFFTLTRSLLNKVMLVD